jgi:hypothetical protein
MMHVSSAVGPTFFMFLLRVIALQLVSQLRWNAFISSILVGSPFTIQMLVLTTQELVFGCCDEDRDLGFDAEDAVDVFLPCYRAAFIR